MKPAPPAPLDNQLRLAWTAHGEGRLADAERMCRAILTRRREQPDALLLLGLTVHKAGKTKQAVQFLRRAVAASPATADYHNNLGAILEVNGEPAEAIACYRRALERAPASLVYLENLTRLLTAQKDFDAAAAVLREAERPLRQAEDGLRRTLAADPAQVSARADLIRSMLARGDILAGEGQFDEAEAVRREVLRLDPANAAAWHGIGHARRGRGDWAGAEAAYGAAVAADPHHALARFSLGAARLVQGRMVEGWPDLVAGGQGLRRPLDQDRPLWRGEDLGRRTLLLHSDSGLGDDIMFARYVPVAARRAQVAVAGPSALRRLFLSLDGIAAYWDKPPFPPHDVQYPLEQLPMLFGTDIDSIPAAVPYLSADPAAVAAWRARLASLPGLHVGIAWAGNPEYALDRRRSVPIETMARLAEVPGVRFVSLQKGDAAARSARFPGLVYWSAELTDLADTAALIEALDLTISVDTAVAHLAGALGRPVWLLNRLDTDWRWFLNRDDSPWYPTLRQFRQTRFADWDGPIAAVIAALREVSRPFA